MKTYKHKTTLTGSGSASYDAGAYEHIAIQPDVAVYVAIGTSGSIATAANGIKVAADGLLELRTSGTDTFIHVVPVSGSMNAKVFRADPS